MKGLKELVEAAMGEFAPPAPPPIHISGDATRALSFLMRQWSGWDDAILKFGDPRDVGRPSPYATTNPNKHAFLINADELMLNPNRVLLTVTPFRLKQEAVMTGVMLHEAGHARFSHWRKNGMLHGVVIDGIDSAPVSEQTMKFAVLLEEPRIEGHIARVSEEIGATGLPWTMRASSAVLAPFTHLSDDPDQQIMDIIHSWVIRAGKQIGVAQWTDYNLPRWVGDFNKFLHQCIHDHMVNVNGENDDAANRHAAQIMNWLTMMILSADDTGTYMVDMAREILDLLYPEGSDAAPQSGCQMGAGEPAPAPSGTGGEGDEGQDGEGNSEPSDPGSGDDPGVGDSGDGDQSEDGQGQGQSEDESALQAALQEMEGKSKSETMDDAAETSKKIDETGGLKGGMGPGTVDKRGFRIPTPEERGIKRGAESFLRNLIEPTEATKVMLTDSPSSSIDPARYAAWRADGGQRDPQFFRRTRRSVVPSPPVDIAILVDISSSMSVLQKPSALLSWALSSACTDLRNFAGRGTQIRSCLIHWGDRVRTIQAPGQRIEGLKEYDCDQGTSAMHTALAEVENLMPGFFSMSPTPTNRLLIHFTDWELWSRGDNVVKPTARALAAGVNMLSVVPQGYSVRRSSLPEVLRQCRVQRGRTELVKYNPANPGQVWEAATELLDLNKPEPMGSF